MTLKKRLLRLETSQPIDTPLLESALVRIIGKSDDDVIGIGIDRGSVIPRQPGESFVDLVERARTLLATPWCGIPLILMCAYADKEVDQ